jgi:Glycosyltransferase family 87
LKKSRPGRERKFEPFSRALHFQAELGILKIPGMSAALPLVVSLTMLVGMHAYFRTVIIPAQEATAAAYDQPRGNLSDLYPRWLGAKELLLHHRNPYSAEVTADIQRGYWGRELDANKPNDPKDEMRFAYPLYVVFLLAPTVTLPFESVQRLYLSITITLSVFAIWLWMRSLDKRINPAHVAVAAMLFFGSYPVVQAIHLQQLALLVFGLIALAVSAVAGGMFSAAGVVLAIAMVKPQTTIPIAGWFLFWSAAAWKDRRMLVISFVATMIVMCVGASLLLPGWVGDWREGTASYVGYTAGVPTHLQVLFGKYVGTVIGLALCVGTAIVCWKTRRDSPSSDRFKLVPALILTVNMAVTPLWHEYDHLFLLPAVLLIFCWRHEFFRLKPFARAVVSLCAIAFAWQWVGAFTLTVIATGFQDVARDWQILPWLPVFFAPTLVLVSLFFIALTRLRHFLSGHQDQ